MLSQSGVHYDILVWTEVTMLSFMSRTSLKMAVTSVQRLFCSYHKTQNQTPRNVPLSKITSAHIERLDVANVLLHKQLKQFILCPPLQLFLGYFRTPSVGKSSPFKQLPAPLWKTLLLFHARALPATSVRVRYERLAADRSEVEPLKWTTSSLQSLWDWS